MVSLRFSLLLALASALQYTNAFVPHQKSFGTASRSSQANVAVATDATIGPFSRETKLSMILDQFIENRDTATRKKATEEYISTIQKRVDRINDLEATVEDLGDDELQAKTEEFKARLAKDEDINGPILEEAFAVVREAAW